MTGCVDGFALALTAIAAIFPITVSGASGIIFIVQNPCMAAAGRAGPGPIAAVAVLLVNVSAKIFDIMALITLVVLLMTSGCMRLLDVGALQGILLTAWAGADNAGGRTSGNLCRRFLDAACGGGGDSAGGDKVVKIGVFEPASGDSGAGGKKEMLGMQYANQETPTVEIGGETYKVELVYSDNGSDSAKAVSAASKLVNEKVSLVLGS